MEKTIDTLWNDLNNAGYETRVVGGWVRDHLATQFPKDKDFCTTATPDQMIEFAQANDYRIEPTGLQHGTVSFIIAGEAYEITTLRIDTDTDGRHAEVEFTTDFMADARRRDLTINAMSMDIRGNIYDYFGGQEDLRNGVIRFVGNAEERIQEDYLRILRYFRFAARIDYFWANMPEGTLEAITQHKDGLTGISKERVWQEMSKLFVAPFGIRAVAMMQEAGISEVIGLPDLSRAFSWNKRDAATIVASFFQNQPKECRAFCQSWKMSNEETNKAVFIASHTQIIHDRQFEDLLVAGYPRDWVVNAIHISFLRERARTWEVPTFPVKGQDLLDAGMQPGKEMGQKLVEMKRVWVDSRFTMTKEELMG